MPMQGAMRWSLHSTCLLLALQAGVAWQVAAADSQSPPQLTSDPDAWVWQDECAATNDWRPQPSWLGNPSSAASLLAEDGTVCFQVSEPGRGMKWSRNLPPIELAEAPWLMMRYRVQNLTRESQDYLIYLRDGQGGRELAPVKPPDLIADGQWHLLAVDVSTLTDQPAVDLMAVQVQSASEGQARLWLDWIGFSDAPPEAAQIVKAASTMAVVAPWIAPLARATWAAQPSWLGNPAASHACSVTTTGRATQFQVAAASQGMKWSWPLPAPVALGGHRYATMRYRARGVSPRGHYALCFIGTTESKGDAYEVALASSEVLADGRWHTAWANLGGLRTKFTSLTALACEVQALTPNAELELQEIRLTSEFPLAPVSDVCAWRPGADFAGYQSLPLSSVAAADGKRWVRQLRLTQWPETNRLTAEGIPFELNQGGLKFAATSLGEKGDLRLATRLRASEVYLFLLARFQGAEEPVYGEGRFRAIRDLDRFRVRLEYGDGTAEECLPLDTASREFGLARSAQVVVAAADPAKELRAVVVRDLTGQAAFAVAAVTARVDGERGFPEALEEAPPMQHRPAKTNPSGAPRFELSGAALGFQTGTCAGVIDFGGQPTWRELHDPATGRSFLPRASPLLELNVDGRAVAHSGYARPQVTLQPGTPGLCQAQYVVEGADGLIVFLLVETVGSNSLAVTASLLNNGAQPRRLALTVPRIGPYRLGTNADATYYLLPKRGAAFDNRSCAYRERYCGLFPLQFVDTFNPAEARGLTVRTEDMHCAWKHYRFEKNGDELMLAVDYAETILGPGERLETPRGIITFHDGFWQRGFEAYRSWARTWYQPLAPRKPWFREVFNFRQRFLHWLDPLYDGQRIDLQRAVDEARREFGGIDYLHLFDWGNCGPYGRIYGRTGDYSPFDYLQGGQGALREAMGTVQAQGIPVGLYIEGYLLDERGRLGQQFGKEWQLIDAAGNGARWPDSTEIDVCSFVAAWRQVQASTYAEKARQLQPNGMYIDEYGFAGANFDCWSKAHGHEPPAYAVVGERDATRLIRQSLETAQAGVAIYTEETPVDVVSQFQDGSFTYAMATARQTVTRVPLNLTRFAIPSFKTIEILSCDKPTGSWATGVKWVFFNGEALWLEGPATEWFGPDTRAAIRTCYRILRQHRDAFTSDAPMPLVPTLQGGVFANAFPVPGKTVYTLYNSRHRTVRGEMLLVPCREGMVCEDAWRGQPAAVRRMGADTVISVELGPQEVGCIVVAGAAPAGSRVSPE